MRSRRTSDESRRRDAVRPAPVRHALDLVIASDPGLTRWRAGARAALAATAASAALVPLAHARHEPATVVLAGIVVSIMAAARVFDDTPRAQRLTMLLAAPAAIAPIALGSLAAHHLWLDQLFFCVVVFCATFARRYGPRGSVLGLLAFMGYFFSLFARTGAGDLRLASISVLVGVAIAYIARFAVVRDRPDRLLDEMLVAFRARAAALLDALARRAEAATDAPWRVHRSRISIARLNDAALAL